MRIPVEAQRAALLVAPEFHAALVEWWKAHASGTRARLTLTRLDGEIEIRWHLPRPRPKVYRRRRGRRAP